ncbi:uncharacterized protein LOC113359869 [Papaver somniferum]|uniref:uncharacterized protein LOC113359869 n=1 Tax=Papaver somniferum TaxID=3469 RepID=UPI000E6F810F|nr:uncharacterized protein LOC113359869 [Papaver somniferum]
MRWRDDGVDFHFVICGGASRIKEQKVKESSLKKVDIEMVFDFSGTMEEVQIAETGDLGRISAVLVTEVEEKKVVLTVEWDPNYREKKKFSDMEYQRDLGNFDGAVKEFSKFKNAVNAELVARNQDLVLEDSNEGESETVNELDESVAAESERLKIMKMSRWLVKQLWFGDDFDWLYLHSVGINGNSGGLLSIWNINKIVKEDERIGVIILQLVFVLRNWWNGPICFVVDMNAVRCDEERNIGEGEARNNEFLNNFITNHELVDLPLVGGAFTWSDMQEDPLLCRLDRFLLSVDFDLLFPDAIQVALTRIISDHKPLLLVTKPNIKSKPYFKFENGWLVHKDFLKKVTEWWGVLEFKGQASFVFFKKLHNLIIANARKKRNSISKLEVDGVESFDQDGIKANMRSYFETLFFERNEFSFTLDNLNFPSIAKVEKVELEKEFTEDEVFDVVKHFGKNKSPGPDGFSMEFYKDYRPLSLLGSAYKVLFKVLANRLKKVMHKLVSEFQGDFIKGKQILDGVLIAGDCVDSRLKEKKTGILCKIDMEKAFDNVRWSSLLRILEKHGFGRKWISWIRWRISSTHISVLMNGSSTEKFKPTKGLRQGDSLSPFLFLLMVEILSKLRDDAVMRKQIKGFEVLECGMISHLQFPEDTLIFVDAKEEEVKRLLLILNSFEILIGMQLNSEKSTMINVGADEVVDSLALELGCKVEKLDFKYLGLPIGATARCTSVWDEVIKRMEVKLISFLEEEISFKIWEVGSYQKLFGKLACICKPKHLGGLGVKNLKCTSKALKAKWIRRYANERKDLWRKVVQQKLKYGEDVCLPTNDHVAHGRSN